MHKLTRKEFIQMAAASSVAIPLLGYGCVGQGDKSGSSSGQAASSSGQAASSSENDDVGGTFYDEIGFQVYTLRDLLVENAKTLFKDLADAGIKNIEFFDPLTLNSYVPIVKDNGMNPLATHFSSGYVTGIWRDDQAPLEGHGFENVVEDCAANGIKYLGVASLTKDEQKSLDAYKRFAEQANVCGEQSKGAGVQLFYHNHNFEFGTMDGTTPYEEMLKIFDKDLVKLELDVFWAAVAGQDPVAWINRIAPWMLFLHLKDLKEGLQLPQFTTDIPPDSFIELGDGIVKLEAILTEAKKAGITTAIIDQDDTQMDDKIASVKKNTAYIKGLGI